MANHHKMLVLWMSYQKIQDHTLQAEMCGVEKEVSGQVA